jgi:hypothetical protein
MMVLTGIYNTVTKAGFTVSDYLAREILLTVDRDKELVRFYNEDMSGGKWKYMMSSKHVDFKHWNDEDSEYPAPVMGSYTEGAPRAEVIIGRSAAYYDGECELPEMDVRGAAEEVYVLNKSLTEDDFRLLYDDSLVSVQTVKITDGAYRLDVAPVGNTGAYEISVAFDSHTVVIRGSVIDTREISDVPCVVAGRLEMICDTYSSKSEPDGSSFLTIDNYGLSGKALKAYPLTVDYEDNGPYVSYDLYVPEDGTYEVTVVVAPSNNTFKNQNLSFGLRADGGDVKKIDLFPERYMAGYGTDKNWCEAVLRNCREFKTAFDLTAGKHRLDYIVRESMVVMQKIVIRKV